MYKIVNDAIPEGYFADPFVMHFNDAYKTIILPSCFNEEEPLMVDETENPFSMIQAPMPRQCYVPESIVSPPEPTISPQACLSRRLADYTLKRKLGEGSFGSVFLAEQTLNCGGRAYVAVKVVRRSKLTKETMKSLIFSEQTTLKYLTNSGSHFFPQLIESFVDPYNYYFTLEFLSGGTLRDTINRAGKRFSLRYINFILAEITYGIKFLHKHNIIHRDIKPENILFDADGHIVISDLGLSRRFDTTDTDNRWELPSAATHRMTLNPCGTPGYMAPELYRGDFYSFKVDVWSLGCIFYELLFGNVPFRGKDGYELARDVMYFNPCIPENHGLDYIALNLLSKMLEKSPDDRINIDEVMNHDFFKEVDWDLIEQRSYDLPGEWVPPSYKVNIGDIIEKEELVDQSKMFPLQDCSFRDLDFVSPLQQHCTPPRGTTASVNMQHRLDVGRRFVKFIGNARNKRENLAVTPIKVDEPAQDLHRGDQDVDMRDASMITTSTDPSPSRRSFGNNGRRLSSYTFNRRVSAYLKQRAMATEREESGTGHARFSAFDSIIVPVEEYVPLASLEILDVQSSAEAQLSSGSSAFDQDEVKQVSEHFYEVLISNAEMLAVPSLLSSDSSPPITPLLLTPSVSDSKSAEQEEKVRKADEILITASQECERSVEKRSPSFFWKFVTDMGRWLYGPKFEEIFYEVTMRS